MEQDSKCRIKITQRPNGVVNCGGGTFMCYTFGQKVWKFHGERSGDKMPGEEEMSKFNIAYENANRQKRHSESADEENTRKLGRSSSTGSNYSSSESECSSQPSPLSETTEDLVTDFLSPAVPPSEEDSSSPPIIPDSPEQERKTKLPCPPPSPIETKNKVDVKALSDLINSLLKKHSLVQSGLELLKKKPALALRLQQRRPRKVLADQGIIPPLKSPAAFYEQIQKLERARTGDFLNKKMQDRPEREDLVQKHILEDTSAYDSIVAHQKELKKAQLVDDLNEKIFFRPGVFELVEKNILPADETVAEALKEGHVQYKKVDDYIEEDSSDAFSPEQPLSLDQGSSIGSPPVFSKSPGIQTFNISTANNLTWSNQATLAQSMSVTKQEPMMTSSSSKMPRSVTSSHSTAGHPYLYRQSSNTKSSKSSSLSQRNIRKKQESKPKFKKFKYHQYIPPDQQGKSTGQPAMPDSDTPYARLLEQQQLYLQLQIMKQHFPTIIPNNQNQPSTSAQRQTTTKKYAPPPPPPPPVTSAPPSERKKRTFTLQQLEDMKVAELKDELKARKEKVTGTKEVLVERLKRFAVPTTKPAPATQSVNESITGLINATIEHTIRANTEQALAAAVSNNGAAGALLLKARTMSPPLQQQNQDNNMVLQTQISPPPSFAIQVVTSQHESRPSVIPMDTQNQENKNHATTQVSQPSTFHFASTSDGLQIFSAAASVNSMAANTQQSTVNANSQFQFNTATQSNVTFSTGNNEPQLQNTSVPGQRVIAQPPAVQFKVEGRGDSQYQYTQKLKDELLHKQQKEIEDLRRMVELHRTQLHQFQEKERQHDMSGNNTNTNSNLIEQQEALNHAEQSMKRQHISHMLQKHLQNRITNKEPPTMINGLNQQQIPLIKEEIQAMPDNVFSYQSNTMPPNVSLIPSKQGTDGSSNIHIQQQDESPIVLSIKPPLERTASESKEPPKYDHAIQMLNEEKRRSSHHSYGSQENIMGSPSTDVGAEDGTINADMEDILDLIAGGGELPVTPTRQKSYPQSVVIDHRQPQHATMHYHYQTSSQQHQNQTSPANTGVVHRRNMDNLHRAISCNELEIQQQNRRSLDLPTLVPLSDMSQGFQKDLNLQRRHSGDILDTNNMQRRQFSYSNHTGLTPLFSEHPTDFTSLLVSSAGDILMDSTRVPPSNLRMNDCVSPESIALEPTLQHGSTMRQHRSQEDLTQNHPNAFLNLNDPYSTQPFSPMDTGSCDVQRNSGIIEDRVRDPHLSSSSIHSGSSLDKCLDSANVPHHTSIYLRHYEQPLAGASPQRNSHLIKSSSQELLSDHGTTHFDHSMQVDDLGWLDLTLSPRVQAPPSPMTLHHQRASVHSSMGSILGQDSVGNPFNLGTEPNEFDLIDQLDLNSIGDPGLDSWDNL